MRDQAMPDDWDIMDFQECARLCPKNPPIPFPGLEVGVLYPVPRFGWMGALTPTADAFIYEVIYVVKNP